jgi:peptidoglycan/LPS O-acetylase OafA/YrhL
MEKFRIMRYVGAISLPAPKESLAVTTGVLVCSALLGVAVHLLIEKPIIRSIRKWQRARSPSETTQHYRIEDVKP